MMSCNLSELKHTLYSLTWLLEILAIKDVIEEHLVSGDPGPDGGVVGGRGRVQSLTSANKKLVL